MRIKLRKKRALYFKSSDMRKNAERDVGSRRKKTPVTERRKEPCIIECFRYVGV